jgi:multidrug transporter EmrE-like cation transporter
MGDAVERLLDDDALRFGVAMGAIETVADYCLKRYTQTEGLEYISATISGYSGVLYLFQRALRKGEKLGRVNAFWNAFTSVSNVLAGMALGETYSPKQLLGFALISTGIFLI